MAANNPYESPESPLPNNLTAGPSAPPRRLAFWFKSLFALSFLFLLVALLLPAFSRQGAGTRISSCFNNVRQIQLAILNYESANGHFPPAYTVDADGNRLHSWRTLILPYIEEGALYESIDLTKPWDDPVNAKARSTYIYPYICPSANHEETKTTYMALTGPNHVMEGSVGRNIREFSDSAGWAMIIDVPSDQAVHWMSPYDADEKLLEELSEDSDFQHDGIFIVGFMDNHTTGISTSQLKTFRENLPKLTREVRESL